MPKLLLWPLRAACLCLLSALLYLNIRLYDQPKCVPLPGGGHLHPEVVDQLHFLKKKLRHERAGEEAQLLYPEGYVFIYALYALAWCDVAATLPPGSSTWQEGLAEIAFSLNALDSPTGRQVFSPDLPLSYGAFYRGWTAYVRGRYLQLRSHVERDSAQSAQFQAECAAIARAIGETEKPYLQSYRDGVWPADNLVCMAALSLHDRISAPQFQEVKNEWLTRIKRNINPEQPLMPHAYDLDSGIAAEGMRGASQVLMLNFLWEVDSVFAQAQYPVFRQHFLAYRLGLPGIREYPHGTLGGGDVDSGPVVMGIGGAASIVGIRTAARYGDWGVWAGLRSGVEALLLPQRSGGEKKYLFGQVPVADAFMAWSQSATCPAQVPDLSNWRWKFQVISVLLASICIACTLILRRQSS